MAKSLSTNPEGPIADYRYILGPKKEVDRVYRGMFYKTSFESIYTMNMVGWLSH